MSSFTSKSTLLMRRTALRTTLLTRRTFLLTALLTRRTFLFTTLLVRLTFLFDPRTFLRADFLARRLERFVRRADT